MSDELRPHGQDDSQLELEDDPLAELARIVAGEAEPEVAAQPAVEPSTNIEPQSNALDTIDNQLEQVGKDLEAALTEEFEPAAETPAEGVSDIVEAETGELIAEEQDAFVDQVEASAPLEVDSGVVYQDDSFLDGLRIAIEADGDLQPAEMASNNPAGFEEEMISALSQEVNAGNQTQSQIGETVEESVEIVQLRDSETEAALSTEFSQAEVSPSVDPVPHQDISGMSNMADDAVVAESDVPDQGDIDHTATAGPSAPHSLEDDLGDVFANEFEQILANDPEHTVTAGNQFQTSPDAAAGSELDFGTAFAEELGVENLVEAQGWDVSDTAAENAAFAEAAQPVSGYDNQNFEPEYDPAHTGDIPGIDDSDIISAASENSGGSKKYAVAALLIALFAGSIAAGYGFLGGGETTLTGSPQLVKAGDDPFKIKPDDPGGRVAANQDKASYESVEGQDTAAPEQETLVSDTEEPATVDESKLVEVDEPATNAAQKSNERLTVSEGDVVKQTTPADLTPRVVQTVTVKPDGTIITGPSLNPAKVVEEATNAAVEIATNPTAKLTEALGKPKPVETTLIQKPQAIDGAQSTGSLGVPEASPLPKPKPVEVAAVKPKPAKPAVRKSEWVVQVSSQRSPEAAQSSYSNLRNRFSALRGRSMSIQRANVNGSTFYRVRVQTASRNDANKLCGSLKSSGGSCFVTR